MLNGDFIKKAFLEIEKYLKILQKRKGINGEKLKQDTELLLMVAHALQFTIQALTDIGTHILSEIGSERWEDYADIPRYLSMSKIISEKNAEIFVSMVKMRNILAHEYISLDAEKVADVINNRLDGIMTIVLEYKNYFEKHK